MSGYPYRRHPGWTDDDKRYLQRLYEDNVLKPASASLDRSPNAVRLQLLRQLGVPEKVVNKLATRRKSSGWSQWARNLWAVTNHQVVGGIVVAILLSGLAYGLVTK